MWFLFLFLSRSQCCSMFTWQFIQRILYLLRISKFKKHWCHRIITCIILTLHLLSLICECLFVPDVTLLYLYFKLRCTLILHDDRVTDWFVPYNVVSTHASKAMLKATFGSQSMSYTDTGSGNVTLAILRSYIKLFVLCPIPRIHKSPLYLTLSLQ